VVSALQAPSRYEIDAKDVLVSVNEAWLAFARENGAPRLTRQRVLGRVLWDFVSGDATRELYGNIFERVRRTDSPVLLPFRCDSPELRRDMRLDVYHVANGCLRFDAVLVRTIPRLHLSILDSGARRSDAPVRICSCCKRIAHRGRWIELEDGVVRLRLFSDSETPQLDHVWCADCASHLRAAAARPK
jgi:hypothetical protein